MTTGKSPAMLMYGRQIQSRLDLIRQKEQIAEHLIPKTQLIVEKDYMSVEKWRFGKVLHYELELDDQRVWKRHVNQIRKVGGKFHTSGIKSNAPDIENSQISVEKPVIRELEVSINVESEEGRDGCWMLRTIRHA